MSEVRVEINDAELRNILKSGEMQSLCAEQASKIAGRAGAGYATRSHQTATRVIFNVYADSKDAKRDNMKNNTLLKAMGG